MLAHGNESREIIDELTYETKEGSFGKDAPNSYEEVIVKLPQDATILDHLRKVHDIEKSTPSTQ